MVTDMGPHHGQPGHRAGAGLGDGPGDGAAARGAGSDRDRDSVCACAATAPATAIGAQSNDGNLCLDSRNNKTPAAKWGN